MTDIFDHQQALEQAGDDPELAKDLFQMLIAELPELLAKLKQALAEQDHTALWDHAHKIHGSTAYCGVPTLKTAAHDLENCITQELEMEFARGVSRVAGEINQLIANKDLILAQFD